MKNRAQDRSVENCHLGRMRVFLVWLSYKVYHTDAIFLCHAEEQQVGDEASLIPFELTYELRLFAHIAPVPFWGMTYFGNQRPRHFWRDL